MQNPAQAQNSVDEAFDVAIEAARKKGGPRFTTDEAGLHLWVQRHAPEEYGEYRRVLREARAAMRGTKYEGAIV